MDVTKFENKALIGSLLKELPIDVIKSSPGRCATESLPGSSGPAYSSFMREL